MPHMLNVPLCTAAQLKLQQLFRKVYVLTQASNNSIATKYHCEFCRLFEKLPVEMTLPEDGDDERRNASECQSNSVPWCVKGGELSAGLTMAQLIRT